MAEENDFKVVDRRHTASAPEAAGTKETRGEGFIAKDAPASFPDEIDFSTFVLSLATSALISMGLTPDPSTKKVQKNMLVAKQNIDILGLIRDKTRGNLSEDESKLVESLLTEIRLRFVDASK